MNTIRTNIFRIIGGTLLTIGLIVGGGTVSAQQATPVVTEEVPCPRGEGPVVDEISGMIVCLALDTIEDNLPTPVPTEEPCDMNCLVSILIRILTDILAGN
jgi:hypothetical protein